jgi:hypothetical protein
MTLPCPHYAPVSGSHFSQLLITRQCRVLPLPTSCQPFPPSLTSRATQPPPSPQGVASFNLAQSSCPAYLLPQSHPFQSCKFFLLRAHSISFLDAPSPQWHLYYRSFHAHLAYNCFKLVPAGLSLSCPRTIYEPYLPALVRAFTFDRILCTCSFVPPVGPIHLRRISTLRPLFATFWPPALPSHGTPNPLN